jgi:hypothetical protein
MILIFPVARMRVGKLTCTSNVKYFFRFFMIMTRNGNLIPSVFFGSEGHVINVTENEINQLLMSPIEAIYYIFCS